MADISGTWLGTYWHNEAPTRFEATFVQGGNALSGVILDDGYLGEANLVGEVIGRSIQFTKRYVGKSYPPIRYTGTLSDDENLIYGSWSITSSTQGKWEAHRSDNDLMADLKNRLSQQVPVGAGLADTLPMLSTK
jgi:hypothetical protein